MGHQINMSASQPSPPLTKPNLLSALAIISGGGLGPQIAPSAEHIKEAESALLSWEATNPDGYAAALLSVVYSENNEPRQCPLPRLAALLSLKASVGRKWKDRGRGARPLPRARRNSNEPGAGNATSAAAAAVFMSDQTKDLVRHAILSVIIGTSVFGGESPQQQPITNALPQLSPTLAASLANDSGIQSACTSLIAKIGRLDLPMKFHDLIPTLVTTTTSAGTPLDDQRRKYNALQALDAVLAELCDKRLLLDKKYVGTVTTEHLATLVHGGFVPAMENVSITLTSDAQLLGNEQATLALRYVTVMISVLRRLLRHSLPAAHNASGGSNEAADKVYEIALQSIHSLLRIVRQSNGNGGESVGNLLEEMCRLVIGVQKAHPIEAGRYLGPFLELFYHHFVEISGTNAAIEEDSAVERFIMTAMTFLSNVLSCSKYEIDEKTNAAIVTIRQGSTISADGTTRTITSTGDTFVTPSTLSAIEHAVQVVWGYFTTQRMERIADLAIRRHMILSSTRLEEWSDDPEGYFHSEENRTAEDDINACAQALYLSLVESKIGRSVVAPRIVAMLQDLEGQAAAARTEAEGTSTTEAAADSVLSMDSIYTAAGISLSALEDGAGFSFASFFDGYLLPCLEMLVRDQKETSNIPILRHRIVWLIASNTFSVPVASRCRLYQAILTIIVTDKSRQNDIVVRLTAVQVLNNSLFERDESLLIFKEHSGSIISALYSLASLCEEYDSRSLVLSCVSFVLTYLIGCGTMSESTGNAAVGPLAQIWQTSIEQNALLKRDVLSILSIIAQAVGPELSARLHPIALPMIDASLDPAQREENLFLAEDALGLWLSLVRLSLVYSAPLGALFPRAQGLLDEDLEHMKVLMMLTEGYILLGGPAFLNAYSSPLQSILVRIVGQVSPRGAAYAMLVFEALLRAYPVEGAQLLLQCGTLATMIQACAAYYNEDNDSEPDRVISLYLTTLARALIAFPRILDSVVSTSDEGAAFGPNELVQLFFKLFNSGGYHSSDALRRKLWTLMFLALLPPTESLYGENLVNNIEKLLTMCLSVIGQETNVLAAYDVGYDDEEESFVAGEQQYKALLRRQNEQDVAVITNFREAFITKLESLKNMFGPDSQEAASLASALNNVKT